MSDDLPPDLLRLRVIETWCLGYLERVRARIREVEQREAASGPRVPPPDTPYRLQRGIDQRRIPMKLHVSGCSMAKNAHGISEEQARQALVEQVVACGICRPEVGLGMPDYMG